jgi:DNA-binding transcriptional regulator YdaS (Cro superfamily)
MDKHNNVSSPKLRAYLAKRGNVSMLAKRLGISPGAVDQWKKKLPMGRLHEVSRITRIPLKELRPDQAEKFR